MAEPEVARLDANRLESGLFREDDPPSTGCEVGDPRLDAVIDAAFKSQYQQAAGLAQQAWDEGARDLRLIGYLLYGHFLERGVDGLSWAFAQATGAMSTQWDAIGPSNKSKAKSADGAFNWYFEMTLRQLTHHEKSRDERYQRWATKEGVATFASVEESLGPLLAATEERFPEGKCTGKLRNLAGWIGEQHAALRRFVAESDAKAQAVEAPPDELPEIEEREERVSHASGSVFFEGAPPLQLLMRKIEVFERLVKRGDLRRAAVVGRDVDQLVQGFDPVVFLPKLFVPFLRLMSETIDKLEPAMADLESPSFKSLVRLYHADLEAFADERNGPVPTPRSLPGGEEGGPRMRPGPRHENAYDD